MSKTIGNTYLGTPGKIKPNNSYEIININSTGGYNGKYFVTLRITEACDLHCSYCDWKDGKHYEYASIIESIDKLFEFFQKQQYKQIQFYFHGGEPTRHKNIVQVLEHIKHKSDETGIEAVTELQTNLTIKTDILTRILPLCDSLNITFHYLELVKRPHKLQAFNNNMQYIRTNGETIHNLDIMLEDIPSEQIDEFYQLVEGYLEYDKIINSEMIYGFGYNSENYNEQTQKKHYEFYKKYNKTDQQYKIDGKLYTTNDMFKNGLDCTGWWCAAGVTSIFVNGDGNVFNCGIHMTNHIQNHPDAPFTNLITDPTALTKMTILNKTGTKCRWDYCGGDFYLEKVKK
jgi:MoaA/NifB/PqqE/SkfB family radical SAM enzyme